MNSKIYFEDFIEDIMATIESERLQISINDLKGLVKTLSEDVRSCAKKLQQALESHDSDERSVRVLTQDLSDMLMHEHDRAFPKDMAGSSIIFVVACAKVSDETMLKEYLWHEYDIRKEEDILQITQLILSGSKVQNLMAASELPILDDVHYQNVNPECRYLFVMGGIGNNNAIDIAYSVCLSEDSSVKLIFSGAWNQCAD